MSASIEGRTTFELPEELAASKPPEARGVGRDEVRLLVARRSGYQDGTFRNIVDHVAPGDLLVVNTSATLPAALDALRGTQPIVVHLSSPLEGSTWVVELRLPDGSGPLLDGSAGEKVSLEGGAGLEIVGPYLGIEGRSRMLVARLNGIEDVQSYLARWGRPISYAYVTERWPLEMYQTVFARQPGSAEMPSAARPFTSSLVTELVTRGVTFAPLVLHSGVSSASAGEPPLPERFRVPAATARLVNETRATGGRVIAVGTTVTRALESAVAPDGTVAPAAGWTELVLGGERPARVVTGLVTGWHAPEASHRGLLEAVAGRGLVEGAYRRAVAQGYLWHEFGDSCLFLP